MGCERAILVGEGVLAETKCLWILILRVRPLGERTWLAVRDGFRTWFVQDAASGTTRRTLVLSAGAQQMRTWRPTQEVSRVIRAFSSFTDWRVERMRSTRLDSRRGITEGPFH
jgi:hypothetical protein